MTRTFSLGAMAAFSAGFAGAQELPQKVRDFQEIRTRCDRLRELFETVD